MDIFAAEIADFSKYKLAKAFLRWARAHEASDLTEERAEAMEGVGRRDKQGPEVGTRAQWIMHASLRYVIRHRKAPSPL